MQRRQGAVLIINERAKIYVRKYELFSSRLAQEHIKIGIHRLMMLTLTNGDKGKNRDES